MKRFFLYLIIFILIFFIMPVLFTKRKDSVETNTSNDSSIEEQNLQTNSQENTNQDGNNQANEQNNSNNGQNSNEQVSKENSHKIKLLHHDTNEVEEVDLEEYIVHVVSAEMPVDFEPEALKAQAIVARTYTMYKTKNPKHDNADICDDSACCQAWISKEKRFERWEEDKAQANWDKISKCVNDTKGKIITYNNEPINAFFHANSGGTTEIPGEVWGGSNLPYLQVVTTAGEEGYTQYSSEVALKYDELLSKLKEKYSDISIDFNNNDDIKILEYTESGRVKTIKFGNHNLSGVETRTLLGLKSTNFEFEKKDGTITFKVIGYGHGVGMSQTGADSLAKQGKNAEEIVKHFYKDVEISSI